MQARTAFLQSDRKRSMGYVNSNSLRDLNMAEPKITSTTTIAVEEDFKKRLVAEAKNMGLGWTTALQVLAREALDRRENERQWRGKQSD